VGKKYKFIGFSENNEKFILICTQNIKKISDKPKIFVILYTFSDRQIMEMNANWLLISKIYTNGTMIN